MRSDLTAGNVVHGNHDGGIERVAGRREGDEVSMDGRGRAVWDAMGVAGRGSFSGHVRGRDDYVSVFQPQREATATATVHRKREFPTNDAVTQGFHDGSRKAEFWWNSSSSQRCAQPLELLFHIHPLRYRQSALSIGIMGKDERKIEEVDGNVRQRAGTQPDLSTPPPRKRLPEALQKSVDNEEKLWETTVEGRAQDTTDTNARYAAYTSRIRTIMMSAHRYVAYTSDIGESFRPVAHPYIIRGAYGISWLYIAGDVANEGYKAYIRNQKILHPETGLEEPNSGGIVDTVKNVKNNLADTMGVKAGEGGMLTTGVPGRVPAIEDYRAVAAQRAVFQSVASMGIPAVTIHSIVRYSGRAMKNVKNKTLRTWGPIGVCSTPDF